MKIAVVTSTSLAGYQAYAKNNYQKFLDKWAPSIELHVFSEDNLPQELPIYYHNLYQESPSCKNFVDRNNNKSYTPPYKQKKYKYQFIKFCFKVYAICTASKKLDADILIWLDSDVETNISITDTFIKHYIDSASILSYLNRELNEKNINPRVRLSTETGLIIFNMRHPVIFEFFKRYQNYYDSDNIFLLDETHDAFVFDHLIEEMMTEGKGIFKKLSNGITERPLEDVFKGAFTHRMGQKKWN